MLHDVVFIEVKETQVNICVYVIVFVCVYVRAGVWGGYDSWPYVK